MSNSTTSESTESTPTSTDASPPSTGSSRGSPIGSDQELAALVATFWSRMGGIFGQLWRQKYGSRDASGVWARCFRVNALRWSEIDRGLDLLLTPAWDSAMPPAPGEFVDLIRTDQRSPADGARRSDAPTEAQGEGMAHPAIVRLHTTALRKLMGARRDPEAERAIFDELNDLRAALHRELIERGEIDPHTRNWQRPDGTIVRPGDGDAPQIDLQQIFAEAFGESVRTNRRGSDAA